MTSSSLLTASEHSYVLSYALSSCIIQISRKAFMPTAFPFSPVLETSCHTKKRDMPIWHAPSVLFLFQYYMVNLHVFGISLLDERFLKHLSPFFKVQFHYVLIL